MKFFPAKLWVLLGSAALTAACGQSPTRPGTVEFFQLGQPFTAPVEDQLYRLSPDGGKLAMLALHGEAINIVVRDLSTGEETLATAFDHQKVSGFDWINDQRLVYTTDHEAVVFAVNFDGSMRRTLNPDGEYVQVLHALPRQPDHVLVAKPGKYSRTPDVFVLDVLSGRARRVAKGPPGDYPERWFLTFEGEVAAALVRRDDARSLMRYRARTDDWIVVANHAEPMGTEPLPAPLRGSLGLALDGGNHALAQRTPFTLYRFDFDSGRARQIVMTIEGAACCEVLISPRTGELVSVSASTGRQRHTEFTDPEIERSLQRLRKQYQGMDVRYVSLDHALRRGVAAVASAVYEPDYYLVDLDSGNFDLLADSPDVLAALRQRRASTVDVVVLRRDRGLAFDMAATQLPGPLQGRQVDSVSSRTVTSGSGGDQQN